MVLPDLFTFTDGRKVKSVEDWQARRIELRNIMLDSIYGQLPPKPARVSFEILHQSNAECYFGFRQLQYRIVSEFDNASDVQFIIDVILPDGTGRFPVVLSGDACWSYATDDVIREVVRRGNIFARFNRTEIANDNYKNQRTSPIHKACPGDYGAIAAWAWGYHRAVDFLVERGFTDTAKIAVVGHSRGGKTALLAAATDERIALASANNSGSAGAGCFHWRCEKAEEFQDMLKLVPYWFNSKAPSYAGRDFEMPFDLHFLKALCAPRAFLSQEALGDPSSNPQGAMLTYMAAKEAYKFLRAEDKIAIFYRDGRHEHSLRDWIAFLDFVDWQFKGKSPVCKYAQTPCPELEKEFSGMITKAPRCS